MLQKINHFFATGFFSGYLPFAPGTWGSLLMIVLIMIFPVINNIYFLSFLTISGVFICNYEEKITGVKDSGKIVIDEAAGQLITFMTLNTGIPVLISGFILFRIFDITKPLIIKKLEKLPSGWGVMADDIAAGIFSLVILKTAVYFGIL